MKYLNTKPGSIEEVAASMSKYAAESEYQQMFKKELEKAGKGIGSMTPAEKKAFFNKIDSKYTAKNEQAKNPYAIGMAAAMKAKDDKPPLKKSTITKAHDIAKSIEKDMKKEQVSQKEIDKFHTSLDKLVHKSFGHSSDEKKKEMKKEEKDVPKGYHKMPDGTIMKDSEHKKEVKETHTFITQKINQKKKSVPGEKDVVDPEPKISEPKAKMSFKEAYKKVKEAMNTIGDANADKANQLVGQKDDTNDPDIKKPKAKADTGSKATPVDTSPEVEYKN